MGAWTNLVFEEGEDEAALRQSFIDLSAKHYRSGFTAFEIAQFVFKDMKDAFSRANQAALEWSKDLDVQQKIKDAVNFGEATTAREKRLALLHSIAENQSISAKDRIAAIRLASEIEGEIIKAVEKKVTYPDGDKPKGLPTFVFNIDPKAGEKPDPEIDEDDEDEE